MAGIDTIENYLQLESGRIGPDIYTKTLHTNPWLDLVKKDVWPDEMGTSVQVMTYLRSLPANPLTWTATGTNDGGDQTGFFGNYCVPDAQEVSWGSKLVSYSLKAGALESPPICVEDLRYPVQREAQLRNALDLMRDNTAYAWQDRHRDEYVRLAENKYVPVATGGLTLAPIVGNDFDIAAGEVEPDIKMTQGILDHIYLDLIRDGAGNNPLGRVDSRPQFGVICGPETSEFLTRENATTRDDYRWNSGKVNELLAPLGIERSYKGFYHMVDPFPPRWNFNGGAGVGSKWERVLPYVDSGDGRTVVRNSAYDTATYEDTIVFHQEVYTCMVPKPITSVAGTSFAAQNYMGEFAWRNIPHRTENPDNNIGFFRGVFTSASKPIRPEWGHVIRHLRCNLPIETKDCDDATVS